MAKAPSYALVRRVVRQIIGDESVAKFGLWLEPKWPVKLLRAFLRGKLHVDDARRLVQHIAAQQICVAPWPQLLVLIAFARGEVRRG